MTDNTVVESRTYKAEGNVLSLRRDIPEVKLTSKDVLTMTSDLRNQKEQGENQIKQIRAQQEQVVKIEEGIGRIDAELSKLEKHETRMRVIQEARAKALYAEHSAELIKKIEHDYKWDDSLPDSTNNLQQYQQLQRMIATLPVVAEELAASVIQKLYFKECFFDNPWKRGN